MIEKLITITLISIVLVAGLSHCKDVNACEKPIGDKELLTKYKPCEGGWCLK